MNRTHLLRLGIGVLFIALTTTAFLPDSGPKKTAHYSIEGPFCGGCVSGLKAMAKKIDGVDEVKINVEELAVVISFDAEKTTAEAILKSINDETTFDLALKEVKDQPESSRSPR